MNATITATPTTFPNLLIALCKIGINTMTVDFAAHTAQFAAPTGDALFDTLEPLVDAGYRVTLHPQAA